ncbi:MAG: hypothetical protein LBK96_06230 [Prevotellaceae bacterium]|jgi:hypothetical protein|nr:hypothetical protein [Prevotellaceae bacterium]
MKTVTVAFYLSLFPFAFAYSQSEADSACNLSPITFLPILANYTDFTPERQSTLEKMGDFFEETVLDNFPAETDTASLKLIRSYNVTRFIMSVLNGKLHEMSSPEVRQLAAVVFWRYVCFCGGIDLEKRTGFCDCEWFRSEVGRKTE